MAKSFRKISMLLEGSRSARQSAVGYGYSRVAGNEVVQVAIEPVPNLDPSTPPQFTKKQGQYLAFIYNYSRIHGRAPAESDLQRYFQTTPPTIHQMIKTLELNRLIERTPGQARSIKLLVRPEHLPILGLPKLE